MVKNKILRASALVAASAGLMLEVAGVAGASPSTAAISTTGFGSLNKVVNVSDASTRISRQANVLASSFNAQAADTGNVRVSENTTAPGGAMSGDAVNRNASNTSFTLMSASPTVGAPADSVGGGSGSISLTGANSSNVDVNKDTRSVVVKSVFNAAVFDTNEQSAQSGDVTVDRNTTAGPAVSGNAQNDNMTTTMLNVSQ